MGRNLKSVQHKRMNTFEKQCFERAWSKHRLTTFFSCFSTSSMPNVNFEIATETSSLTGSNVAVRTAFVLLPCGGYGSPAKIAFAYSLGLKSGCAKTACSTSRVSETSFIYALQYGETNQTSPPSTPGHVAGLGAFHSPARQWHSDVEC